MRKGLSGGVAILVVAVFIVGAVAALYFVGQRAPSSPGQEESGGNQSGGTSTGTTNTGGSGETLLEGHWQGTYTGSYGSGEWEWVIKKASNGYTGCLRTTGTYSSGNAWMAVTITVDGNHITVGTVGPNAVRFTGTVGDGTASGTWTFTNNADGGSWQGSRISGDTQLPCAAGAPS